MDENRLYTVPEAARYLSVTEAVIKHAYHKAGNLQGHTYGEKRRRLVLFSRQQLDDFAAHRLKRGRPRVKPTP
jgi:hypothetical protein